MLSIQNIIKSKVVFRASGKQRIIAALIFAVLCVFFGSFAIAAHSSTDMGQYLGRCGFKQRYGLPCPTCGYTTATLAFVQGKIIDSFYIQPACGLICSIFVFTAILSFLIAVFGIKFKFVTRFFTEVKITHIIFAFIVIIASGWAVTIARTLAQR